MKKLILPMLMIAATTTFYSCTNNAENTSMKSPTEKADKDEKEEEGDKTTTANSDKAKTIENLQAAYKGETNAAARYAAFAKKADEEGQKEIAVLFRAASKAEAIHAQNHKEVITEMGGTPNEVKVEVEVKSTKENLEYAISGEAYEVKEMYPAFLKDADASGSKLALITFNYAYKTEKIHEGLYRKALEALNNKQTNTLATVYFVCPTCGNTVENAQPRRCDISMTKGDTFLKIV